jgi:hypothetical protein
MDAIRRFSDEQFGSALESWSWLDLAGKAPLCASPFGDIFLEDAAGVWWLDTLEGALTRPWSTRDEFASAVADETGQDRYLLVGLALAAEERGLAPGPDQVYGFTVPPKLGGGFDPDNVEVIDFVLGVNVTGQLHQQLKDLPPGTKVTGFTVE